MTKQKRKKIIKWLIQALILGLAVWVLAPKTGELINNRQVIFDLDLGWLAMAALAMLLSYLFAALVIKFLSYRRISLRKIFLVQLACGFTNRLLPSGVGGISTNSIFLMKQGYKKAEAVSLALANNVIGFLAFCLTLVLSGALAPSFLIEIFSDTPVIYFWLAGLAFLVFLVVAVFSPRLRKTMASNIRQAGRVLVDISSNPLRFLLSLLSSSGITVCYILTLYFCLRSGGVILSLSELTLVFAASAVAVSASPTPGGLGGTELAMLVALTRFGVASVPALAVVIAFRLISYWLPILPGYIFFRYVGQKRYI